MGGSTQEASLVVRARLAVAVHNEAMEGCRWSMA